MLNDSEGRRSDLASKILDEFGPRALVPWPVYTETDLLLRKRGLAAKATEFGRQLQTGRLTLVTPSTAQFRMALDLLEKYQDIGLDLPDASVMAVAIERGTPILTWDFRHFRTVVVARGEPLRLLVQETELPAP